MDCDTTFTNTRACFLECAIFTFPRAIGWNVLECANFTFPRTIEWNVLECANFTFPKTIGWNVLECANFTFPRTIGWNASQHLQILDHVFSNVPYIHLREQCWKHVKCYGLSTAPILEPLTADPLGVAFWA